MRIYYYRDYIDGCWQWRMGVKEDSVDSIVRDLDEVFVPDTTDNHKQTNIPASELFADLDDDLAI